jgi:hypothetical protein
MNSLLHAYEAYERRILRGELDILPIRAEQRFPRLFLARLGEWMIRSGTQLKRRSTVSGKPMAWSPMTGSKA